MNSDLTDKLEQVEREKSELQAELRRLKRRTGLWAGYLLLILGLFLMGLAFIYAHSIAAFLGVSLTFWGALLLWIRPMDLIRKEILKSTSVQPLKDIHSMLDELGYDGTPRHFSPPTLLGFRTSVVYIPKTEGHSRPSDEQLSREETFISNPTAVKLTPPGLGLSMLLEEDLKTDFSAVDLGYLQANLEKALVEGLEMVEAFQMEVSDSKVQVEIRGTIFDEIIEELDELETHRRLGDPLSSAIACILARSTSRPIVIEGIKKDPKEGSYHITYSMDDFTPTTEAS